MSVETIQSLREVFSTTCIELFRSLNCDIVGIEAAIESLESLDSLQAAPLAYIDAGSKDIDIVIVLRVPMSVLSITYPRFDPNNLLSVSDEKLEDWISELANQMMGRFKNKMLSFGCPLQIGLPEMIYDTHSIQLPVENYAGHRFYFDIDKESIECSLYVQLFNQHLTLIPQQPDGSSIREGEMELF